MATTDYTLAHSLPANVEAERSILGAILLDNHAFNEAAEHLKAEDSRSTPIAGFIREWSIWRILLTPLI